MRTKSKLQARLLSNPVVIGPKELFWVDTPACTLDYFNLLIWMNILKIALRLKNTIGNFKNCEASAIYLSSILTN